jgi:hypothetical protein
VLISNATFGISNLYIVCVGLSLSLSPFCYIDRPDSPDSPDRTMAVSTHGRMWESPESGEEVESKSG